MANIVCESGEQINNTRWVRYTINVYGLDSTSRAQRRIKLTTSIDGIAFGTVISDPEDLSSGTSIITYQADIDEPSVSGILSLEFKMPEEDDNAWREPNPPVTAQAIEVIIVTGRPDYFSWTVGHAPVSGEEFNLLASDWQDLIDNINEVRVYKNHPERTFNPVAQGMTFMFYHYNDVVSSIGDIYGNGGNEGVQQLQNQLITKVANPGDICYADDLNTLITALNSIE